MVDSLKIIQKYREEVLRAMLFTDDNAIAKVAEALLYARDHGHMVFAFGNGGSGATASLFIGELLKGTSYGRQKKFKAMSLNDNIPALLAIANDVSYEDVFVEPLKNFIKPADIVIGISGSGNSKNVVKALEYANSIGAITVALSGFDGGAIKKIARINLHVAINDMEIVQDVHLFLLHSIKRILTLSLQDEENLQKNKTEQSLHEQAV